MILPIYTYGDLELRNINYNIDINNIEIEKLKILLNDMTETLLSTGGVGLAAPQIGHNVNVFIINDENDDFFNTDNVFINCIIKNKSVDKNYMNEGCLSLPTINESIPRYNWIEIEYYDLMFNKQIKTFYGIKARIIQHEYDHICGITMLARLQPYRKKEINKTLTKIKNKRIKTDYIIYKKSMSKSKNNSNVSKKISNS